MNACHKDLHFRYCRGPRFTSINHIKIFTFRFPFSRLLFKKFDFFGSITPVVWVLLQNSSDVLKFQIVSVWSLAKRIMCKFFYQLYVLILCEISKMKSNHLLLLPVKKPYPFLLKMLKIDFPSKRMFWNCWLLPENIYYCYY